MLCRRSFRDDGSPSLRLFVLGLRANKSRLLGPCCLGGSPSSFRSQGPTLRFFVLLSAALLDIHILLPNILIFFCFSLWRGSFFAVVFSLVFSWLLYSCPVCVASIAVPPVRVHVWRSPHLQCVCVVLTLGSCSVLLANSMLRQPWEENLHSITVASALCLFRLAGCPLHSA